MMHMSCLNINRAAERLHQNTRFGDIRDDSHACNSSKKKKTDLKFHRKINHSDRGIDSALCISELMVYV